MDINWTDECLVCQEKHGGTCKSERCRKHFYDPWGDPYPFWVYHIDGNSIDKYIAEKRKRLEE